MRISDWLTLIAVVVPLYFGVKSLRQTRQIQEKAYKYMRLEEILKWALDIIEANTRPNITILERSVDRGWGNPAALSQAGYLPSRFMALMEKGQYISLISADFNVNLKTAVEKTLGLLETHVESVKDLLGSWSPDTLKKNQQPLADSVQNVIKEVIAAMPAIK